MLKWTGPLVFNGIVQTLRVSGEPMIEELSANDLFYRREIHLLKYVDTWLFTPLRSVGIAVPADLGFAGFHLNGPSFGVASLLATGELGPFEVYTTTTEEHLIGDAYSAFNRSTLPLKDAPCNAIGGGEGYFWRRPFHGEKLTLWIYYLCRQLVFIKE